MHINQKYPRIALDEKLRTARYVTFLFYMLPKTCRWKREIIFDICGVVTIPRPCSDDFSKAHRLHFATCVFSLKMIF